MSQSGIPVVSQAAQITSTATKSVSDILSGKNVFEAVGRVVASPFAAAADLSNDLTFHTLEKVPIAGDVLKTGTQFSENPYSAKYAKDFVTSTAKAGAVALSAGYAAPALGVSPLTAGAGTGLLVSGNIGAGAQLLTGGLVPQGAQDLFNDAKSLIPKNSGGQNLPVSNFSSPAQVLKPTSNISPLAIAAIIGGGFVLLLALKRVKK